MSEIEKAKKLVRRRKLAKIEREVILIGAGAGYWWQEEGYWEAQDDQERCLGNLLHGISFFYDIPIDSWIFRPWHLQHFSSPKGAAKAILEAVEWERAERKRKEGEDE